MLWVLAGCAEPSEAPRFATHAAAVSIEAVAQARCDTPPELVDGLSRQLVDAINCLRPGTLAPIPLGGDIRMLRAGRPAFLDARGLDALRAAARDGDRQMVVRWSYRDVALQHLFWLQDDFRGCAVAAPAGLSNHQNGLAVDLDDAGAWSPVMRRHGWANDLPNDRVHFDYQDAEDVGLGALSLLAFQALWNENLPERALALSAELDGETYDALSEAPIEGFDRELCDGGPPPVGPGPVRGPTVAQAAWRGCDAPPELVEGLTDQVARGINCLDPGALVPLRLCREPGCLVIEAPPIPEWLGAAAHAALLEVDDAGPLLVRHAFRDVALQHFLASAAANIGCPGAAPAARSDFNTGQAVWVVEHAALSGALAAAGFSNDGTSLREIYAFAAGDDLTETGTLAFQELWNLNRADDPIDTDGLIGPQTRARIDRAPIAGFPLGLCGQVQPDAGVEPPPRDGGAPADDAGPRPGDTGVRGDRGVAVDGERDAAAIDDAGRVVFTDGSARARLTQATEDATTQALGGCRQSPGSDAWWLVAALITIRRRRPHSP